jgi:hypothetical protein
MQFLMQRAAGNSKNLALAGIERFGVSPICLKNLFDHYQGGAYQSNISSVLSLDYYE